MGHLIIHRTGWAGAERSVRITDERGYSWRVDPQAEIYFATGVRVSRESCIISFAEGLMAAGFTVFVDTQFIGKMRSHEKYPVAHSYPFVYVYYLVGLAWALNHWDKMKNALLSSVTKQCQLHVLEATGKYYMENPHRAFDSLSLVIPV
ncbi:MAG: hypothetical protein WCW31_01705 [Patescibacteria group bacterium]